MRECSTHVLEGGDDTVGVAKSGGEGVPHLLVYQISLSEISKVPSEWS